MSEKIARVKMEETKDDVVLIENEKDDDKENVSSTDEVEDNPVTEGGNELNEETEEKTSGGEESAVKKEDSDDPNDVNVSTNKETTEAATINPVMEQLDITGTANNADTNAKVTFNFEFTITGSNLQPTLTNIPEDMKQPILMMEHGKSVPSLLPDDKVMLFESPILTGKQPIGTIDELRQICTDLLNKPIFGVITAVYKRQKPQNKSRFWKATLEVLVNTSHPSVQASLKSYLDEAIRLMENGSRFCMQISFSHALAQVIAKIAEPFDHNFGKGCYCYFDIYLTNCSKKSDICYSPRVICCCFLCWIFAGPCYMIHRCIAVKDICRVFPALPVVFVNQKGEYEILSLKSTDIPTTYKY